MRNLSRELFYPHLPGVGLASIQYLRHPYPPGSKTPDVTRQGSVSANQLNVSSSTLYRKVKANTGMNVNEYIRLCRLKEAAQLLASRQYRINEVADMLGFSSSSYFAASFQKQFNISPSAFVKSLNK